MVKSREINSSWESSHAWYDKIVGDLGHTYHQGVIIPGVLKWLDLKNSLSPQLLDVGCGQGVLARSIPKSVGYVGIDASAALITAAKRRSSHRFLVRDAAQPLDVGKKKFTHAALILALQNMADPLAVLKNITPCLVAQGKLLIVLNHPCFRIPRQSSWQIDEQKNLQYRRIDSYLSPMKIPIQTHPGKKQSATTWSFHYPLSVYSQWLKDSGFMIEAMEEWCSDKRSSGQHARRENRCRLEFPLFLTFSCSAIF